MSYYAAPKPPKPPVPAKLELVPEVEAIPDDDQETDVIELVSLKEPPPPILPPRRARVRRFAIGIVAAVVGVLALVVAFRPWRWVGRDAHVVPTAQAAVAATMAKRAKPATPPAKHAVVAMQKKTAAAPPATKAKPAAAPPKGVAAAAPKKVAAAPAKKGQPAATPAKPGAPAAKPAAAKPTPKKLP
jgi:hypothetical protein